MSVWNDRRLQKHWRKQKYPFWSWIRNGTGFLQELESQLKEILERQGRLTQELKDLKKVKSSLMQNIVEHMDAEEDKETHSRQMDENKRLIEEVKEKIAANEDALLEIPKEIQTCNDALMMETMTFCYDRLRTNCKEAEEIAEWIKKVRVELKKNIIRKQNREINNKEIYAYMHDIFGKDIINLFDVQNDDVDLITGEKHDFGGGSDLPAYSAYFWKMEH